MSTDFLSLFDVHLVAHCFGPFYCFELVQLQSETHSEPVLQKEYYSIYPVCVTFLNLHSVTSSNNVLVLEISWLEHMCIRGRMWWTSKVNNSTT